MGHKILVAFLLTAFLAACGQVPDPSKDIADDTIDNIGCENAQSRFFDSLYRAAENGSPLPEPESLAAALDEQAEAAGLLPEKFERFSLEFLRQYRLIYSSTLDAARSRDPQELIKALVALETGDASTELLALTQQNLKIFRSRVAAASSDVGKECEQPKNPEPAPTPPSLPAPTPAPVPPPSRATLFEQLQQELPPEIFGSRKTVTTAYQSCRTLNLRPMNASDPSVEGIRITGNHPAGGKNREISSLSDVRRTHYYLNQTAPEAGSGCHDIMNAPLIYDFGGKPHASASNSSLLDLFTNAGSGTKVLGIDCSGYVFTSLAAGGLKLDPDTEMKAVHVMNIPARRYMKPEEGMRCFEHVRMTPASSLLPGDIAATTGHIIMIDEVGPDPFGLSSIQSNSQCTPANINPNRFDFVISQSSPSKGGIGINRMRAKDYFQESSTYRNGFVQFAVAACKAKFGSSNSPRVSSVALVRHKKNGACTTRPFTLQKESCLYLCPAL